MHIEDLGGDEIEVQGTKELGQYTDGHHADQNDTHDEDGPTIKCVECEYCNAGCVNSAGRQKASRRDEMPHC